MLRLFRLRRLQVLGMRILYITFAFQHPSMRGSTRSYYFLKELSKRHAMTLVTLTRQEVTPEATREMNLYTEKILVFPIADATNCGVERVVGHIPFIGARLRKIFLFHEAIDRMKQSVETLIKQQRFDVVLFHGRDIAPVIKDVQDIPVVLDLCDAMSVQYLSRIRYARFLDFPLLYLRYLDVRRREKKLVKRSSNVVFVSRRDKEAILGESGHGKVVSIGVDHEFWKRGSKSLSSNSVVFVGVLDYPPNADAALFLIDKILPILKRSIPDIEVLIVGRNPPIALIERAGYHPEVTITGYVDDVRPFLENAALSAIPMRFGSGVQNKVLEAMAMEVPVVTTSLVAAGLRITDGEDVPVAVADGEAEFAYRVVHLLRNGEERARLAIQGRCFIEKYFNWSHWSEELELMCLAAVETTRSERL